MAQSPRSRLDLLFERALSTPPEDRAAVLDEICGGDQQMHDEIEALLSAHEASIDFFDRLATGVVAPALSVLAEGPDDELRPAQVLSRYRIVERIGAGGMGVVYLARDLSLGRSVALKLLSPHLSSNAAAKARFVAEAKAASLLDHPNIGVIHEAGETADGRLFIAMTHYEGETLEHRIRSGPLPVEMATDIAKQIARALAAAHQKGVIHRDVKPSNILITSLGVAKLLDFGVAKMAGSELTREGVMPGTVAYMSPEQTRSERLDHRTDLWSLGVVLCEMLTGVRPFRSDHEPILIHAIRHDPWEGPASQHAGPAAPLARVIGRCLEKAPARRYASAEAVLADLEGGGTRDSRVPKAPRASVGARWDGALRPVRYASVAVASGLLAAALTLYRGTTEEPAPRAAPREARLAVLPIASAGAAPQDDYLAEGITVELIAQLVRFPALRVIARPSTLPYRDTDKSPLDIGRELNVAALLTGRIDTSGDQPRLVVELVDTRSREPLWSGTYGARARELPGAQLDIARRVAEALVQEVDGAVPATAVSRTPAPDAYLLYLKGRFALEKRDEQSARQAREYFRQALDIDPGYAEAWTGWSDTLDVLTWLSILPPREGYAQSQAAARRALQIDPDLPDAHVSLARVLFRHHFRFEDAAEHLTRAIALNPSHAEARQQYAAYLRVRGRFEEALEQSRLAATLDPLSPMHQVEMGVTHYMARRYEAALDHYRRALDSRPEFTPAYMFIALVYMQQQQYEEALAVLERATPTRRWRDAEAVRAHIFGLTGRRAEARASLAALERLSKTTYVSPWYAALIHLGLGEHDRAIALLERAFDERAWQIPLLPVEPTFDALRSHPRFVALLDRMRPSPLAPVATPGPEGPARDRSRGPWPGLPFERPSESGYVGRVRP